MAQEHVYYYQQNTLYCLDISSPETPFGTSAVGIPNGSVTLFKTINDRLFIGIYESYQQARLQVFNIANPAEPILLSECFLSHSIFDLSSKGNNLYLATWDGVVVVNIEDPAHPVVGTPFQSTYPLDLVAVVGDSLFAHEEIFRNYSIDTGISTWDLTTPQTPSRISFTDTLAGVKAFESDGARLVFNEYRTLRVWNPAISSDFRSGGLYQASSSFPTDLDIVDGFAYFAFSDVGIKIVDTQDTDHLVEVGSHNTGSGAVRIAASNSRMCVKNSRGDLEILQFNSPPDPQLRAQILTPPIGGKGLAVEGNFAFAAGGEVGYNSHLGRLAILDISNPSAPQVISVLDSDVLAYDVVVSGNRAFVSYSDFTAGSEITILDISDPHQPTELGRVQGQGHIPVFTADGDLLFSARTGFQILDTSNPESPVEIGRIESQDQISGILAKDGFAYTIAGKTFQVFDVNDPTAPIALGSAQTRDELLAIDLAGSFVYLAEGSSHWYGLEIFDISEPGAPSLVGSVHMGRIGTEVCISGDHAFVPSTNGVTIVNIANPAAPYVAGYHNLEIQSYNERGASVAASEGRIFMMSYGEFSFVNLESLQSGK